MRCLSSQGVALFGRGEAHLYSTFMLSFAQHVHQLDAGYGGLRRVERLESQHGTSDFDCATVMRMTSWGTCAPLKLIAIAPLPQASPVVLEGEHTANRLK